MQVVTAICPSLNRLLDGEIRINKSVLSAIHDYKDPLQVHDANMFMMSLSN